MKLMQSLEEWYSSGKRISVLPAQMEDSERFHIFCKVEGKGPWLTFLHGFPTCSWDWAKLIPELKPHHKLLLFDFLGFGDSDKPRRHKYSIFEQADITEILWQHFKVEETILVAHDYGDTVALELLSRQQDGMLATKITQVVLLNGGIYVDYQKPLLIQKLLHMPLVGALISQVLSKRTFKKRFASIFSKSHPISESELEQYWQAVSSRGGVKITHRIIRYLSERRKFRSRWENTLESSSTPIRFIWGLEDPVSGRSISEQIPGRIPDADLIELPGVGHYPQLEVPQVVREIITRRATSA